LLWLPSDPHQNGVLAKRQTSVAISEIPAASVTYDSLLIPGISLILRSRSFTIFASAGIFMA
jgi:hypothetical protein